MPFRCTSIYSFNIIISDKLQALLNIFSITTNSSPFTSFSSCKRKDSDTFYPHFIHTIFRSIGHQYPSSRDLFSSVLNDFQVVRMKQRNTLRLPLKHDKPL